MNDLKKFCCQSPACPDYGKFGLNNLTVCAKFGKQDRIRLLYCRTCHERFSERKGSVFFGLRLSDEKLAGVLQHIAEGCGIRQTSRLVGVHRDTVARIKKLSGKQADGLYMELTNGTIRPDRKIVAANGQKDSGSAAQDLKTTVSARKAREIIKRSLFLGYKQETTSEKTLKPKEDEETESNNNRELQDIFYG